MKFAVAFPYWELRTFWRLLYFENQHTLNCLPLGFLLLASLCMFLLLFSVTLTQFQRNLKSATDTNFPKVPLQQVDFGNGEQVELSAVQGNVETPGWRLEATCEKRYGQELDVKCSTPTFPYNRKESFQNFPTPTPPHNVNEVWLSTIL